MSGPVRPRLEVRDVARSFGEVQALAGVSFSAPAGEVIGLLGPNGAGKTTLVRIVATLLVPDAGQVLVEGVDVAHDPDAARRHLGLAGQFAAVDELLTARENLVMVGRLYGLDAGDARERADDLLAWLGLVEAAERRVGTYSGGMRRRLDLGATLIGDPSVLLLDEPTTGLDPRTRHGLWDHIATIAARGTTVVLTSQNLEEVERLASRVIVLDRGAVIADGPAPELQRRVGGLVVEARVAGADEVPRAAAVLAGAATADARLHPGHQRVTVAAARGVSDLVAAGRALGDEGVDVLELGMRLPSLDDVFFSLTGAATDGHAEVDDDGWDTARRGAVVPGPTRPAPPRRRHGLADVAVMTRREWTRLVRTPQLLFFATVQPVLFVVFIAAVFGPLVERAVGGDYIRFLLPGVLVMNVVLAAGTTGVGLAEDMKAGIIDRFRSLPMSRGAVLAARTATDLARNAMAMSLMVAAGFLLGFRLGGSVLHGVAAFGLALLFGYAATWAFAAVGLAVRDPQTAQFAGFAPVLPLVFLSSAWVPIETMSGAIQGFARHQPVNVAVEAVRSLAAGAPEWAVVGQCLAWSAGLLVVFVTVATRQYTRVTR